MTAGNWSSIRRQVLISHRVRAGNDQGARPEIDRKSGRLWPTLADCQIQFQLWPANIREKAISDALKELLKRLRKPLYQGVLTQAGFLLHRNETKALIAEPYGPALFVSLTETM